MMCFHRLGLIRHLDVPTRMREQFGVPDYAVGVLAKILLALPSNQAFSLHSFIETWNRARLNMQLGQNEDIFIAEGILKCVKVRSSGQVPALTQYKAKFFCPTCGVDFSGITEWDNPPFKVVPQLELPDQQQPVNPAELLTNLMEETFPITCRMCNNRVNNASYDIVKGSVTIITLNRFGFENQRMFKIMTPLNCGPSDSPGSQLLGQLVAVVCHQTQPGMHWLSYSKVNNGWFMNNDHHQPFASSPFNSINPSETINMLCYINN